MSKTKCHRKHYHISRKWLFNQIYVMVINMSELQPPTRLSRVRANIEELAFLVPTPYGVREYHKPGVDQGFWDGSGYEPELHEKNIALLENTLAVHGDENDETPWLTSGVGVVAVKHGSKKYDFTSVNLADDGMSYRQGLHFVRQDVRVHPDKGVKARTRIYPTVSKTIANFTTSDAAWALSYPTLNRDPQAISEHLAEWLVAPYELAAATPENLHDTFPLRHFALRHWVGVKID